MAWQVKDKVKAIQTFIDEAISFADGPADHAAEGSADQPAVPASHFSNTFKHTAEKLQHFSSTSKNTAESPGRPARNPGRKQSDRRKSDVKSDLVHIFKKDKNY